MNTYFKIFIVIFSLPLFSSCDKEIEKFTNEETYIYFNIPFKLNSNGTPTTEREEVIKYSFALEESDYKTHTLKLPVNTISLPADKERSYKVEVVSEETTATDEEWNKSSIENTFIKPGEVVDTLHIVLNRTASIGLEEKTITLRLLPTADFKLGIPQLLTAKITFSDILTEPSYWKAISKYVGRTYYKEVYRKWMEIYYLGADPNVETIPYAPTFGLPLWYGNMPYSLSMIWRDYPSTEMFLTRLKAYFDENDVYPNGDTTKKPIRLPATN